MKRFSCACMQNFVALGCIEVGEKFVVGWVGAFRYQLQCYTNLKLGWVVVRLGCNNFKMLNIYILSEVQLFLIVLHILFDFYNKFQFCLPDEIFFLQFLGGRGQNPPLCNLIFHLSKPHEDK